MCRLLRVARARFYAWLHDPISTHEQEDRRLLELIRYSYTASHGVYGARRVFADLREAGERFGATKRHGTVQAGLPLAAAVHGGRTRQGLGH